MKTHAAVFADAEKAASAFERFEKENPPGQYRKSVVDWSAWGKSFVVRTSIKDSEQEEEMDIRDYIGYQKNRGYSDAEARAMWKELENDPRSDGEGADKTIMIQLKRRRTRDTERYEDGAYQEGSKQAKAMGDDEK